MAAALRASSLDAGDEAGEAPRRAPQDELPSCRLDHDAAGPLISEEVRVLRGGHMFAGGHGAHPGHLVPPFFIKSPCAISVTPKGHCWYLELAVGPYSPPAHRSPGEGTAGGRALCWGDELLPCLSGEALGL